ncbi:MAG: NADH-quinone oxidoreductase subunit NuoH [Deltaproteobacteria bacterium]|nr:NADH-quinone oxidoreductase subunit NuoH [Deltaproteobacteria bacterium]
MSRVLDALRMIWEIGWLRGLVVGFVTLTVVMLIAAFTIWFERKWSGRMQNRPGPTERGYGGWLQIFADFFKLLQKENLTPTATDRRLFDFVPPIVVFVVLSSLAVVPYVPQGPAADASVGVLLALAISSLMVFPVWAAGWSSNNKWALLGAMRAVAQSISYEIPLVLSALVPVILAGSFRLTEIVGAQADWHWFAFWPPGPGLAAFVLFYLSSLAEANRIPFDIPEAESELVAGATTEYGGMKFGMFYLGEYVHTFVASSLAALLFFGGWEGPGPDGLHWMLAKALILTASVIHVRWTLVRYRSDQLLRLCWTYFVPAALVLVFAAGLWRILAGGLA